MKGVVVSFLKRQYLVARQQYRHLQALSAHVSGQPLPSTRFVLFGRGRSGTTALVSMLDRLPTLRCEGEVLHNYVPFPQRHVLGRCARSRAEGYGCKILSYQLRDVQRLRRSPKAFLRILHEEHGFDLLYLRRTNLLRHALSNIRARRETFHREKTDASRASRALTVDPEHVVEWMRNSEALHTFEQTLLKGLPYLSLTYEEHIRDPSTHQSTVDEICEYLGIPSAPVETRYQKVAPPSLEEGVANYEELAAYLKGTSYARYLH